MSLNSGVYIITNVKQRNLVLLENPDDRTPLRGRYRKNLPGERWLVTRLENGYHLIQNVEYERYANCGSRAGLDAFVEGHNMEQQWRLQEQSPGKYTIATTDNRSLWMLPDSEPLTPVGLSKVSTDRTCWWTFTNPETEAPVGKRDVIQAVLFEITQLPIPPFSPLILDLVIIQETSEDSISKASTVVNEIYDPLVSPGKVQNDVFRVNITEFKAFGSNSVAFQRFSDFVTFERLRDVEWSRCGGSRWLESGIWNLRVDATKVAVLNLTVAPLPQSGKVIMELINRLVQLDITLVLTLIQPDLEDVLYNSDIFRELGKLASGSMHYLHKDGFSDYVAKYNKTVALPRLIQDAELRDGTIRHLIEELNDSSHETRLAAGNVLSKLAGHAELRVLISEAFLKLVETLKDNSRGAEFVASTLIRLAEHSDLCDVVRRTIPHIVEMLKDKNHNQRSAAITVLSKLAEHEELRDSVFVATLKIVETLKRDSDGAELVTSAIIKLAEHPKLREIGAISRDSSGRTSLSWAAECGLDGVARLLLTHMGINVNAKDNCGQTPLLWAARTGHHAVVLLLLARQGVAVDAKDNYGWTPLLWAAKEGHNEVVRLLLAHQGVDVNARDNHGQTPLWLAACKRHAVVISLLLAHSSIDVNAKDNFGQTPLSWAAQEGHDGVLGLLLAHQGIDVNARDTQGHTPLWLAACKGHEESTRLLLAYQDVDIDAQDIKYGRSPLLCAARNGHDGVIRLLLACHGIEVDTKDKAGWTPLLWAAREGHGGTIRLLLGHQGIEVNTKDNYGWTPLLWAAREGHEEAVGVLLAHQGVNVNARDNHGQTPLWLATSRGHDGLIRLLLAHPSVDVNAMDDHGQTPLSWAAQEGRNGAIGLLLAHKGIGANSKDKQGHTPLWLAARNGQKTAVRLLREKVGQAQSGSKSRLLSRLSQAG